MMINETLAVFFKKTLGERRLPGSPRVSQPGAGPDDPQLVAYKRVTIHPKKAATCRTPGALYFALLLLIQSSGFAASRPLELKWSELSSQISGKTVELTLPGAVTVKGDVATIREDGLVLDVRKTSDPKKVSKGNATIPRASVTLLKVDGRGSNWRVMGTVIGAIGGVALGGYVAAKTASSVGSGVAIFVATASVASVAGNLAGGAADRNSRMIRIVE